MMNIQDLLLVGIDDELASAIKGNEFINEELKDVELIDFSSFKKKTEDYHDRLLKEKFDFNNAINKMSDEHAANALKIKNHKALISKESKKSLFIALMFIVMLLISAIVTFVLVPNNIEEIFDNNFIPYVGFRYFWGGPGIEYYFALFVAGIIGIIFAIIVIASHKLFSLLFTYFVFLVSRTIIALLAYFVKIMLGPIGLFVIAAIFILIMIRNGNSLRIKKYVVRFIINIVCTLIIVFVFFFIAINIQGGKTIQEAINTVLPFLNF